jgi:C-terminal processing protease CtpA/Prc
MDGYGTIVAIDNGKAKLYQTRSISCTPAADYTQDGNTFAADGELDRTLDTILATKPRKLILDLRLNGGGSDQLGLDLASRPTQGVFSDTMDRTLPNGSTFFLPSEVYRTAAGTSYDGAGVPPDIGRPVFTSAELNGGRDSVFSTAVDYLHRQSGANPQR